jgi:hypothetical protein
MAICPNYTISYLLFVKKEYNFFYFKGEARHMWRASAIPFQKREEPPRPERRVITRVDAAIPLTIRLVGTAIAPPPLFVETANISPRGLSIVIRIRIKVKAGRVSIQEEVENSAKMVKYLLLRDRILGVGINILPQGGSIDAMGTVKWHVRSVSKGLYSVRAGILLDEIDWAHKREWFEFLTAVYQFLACLELRRG